MRVTLHSSEDTKRLAQAIASAVQRQNPGCILFYGDLGVGKTTLIRHLVEALPGGNSAETASPSFTICNIYCTKPLIHHFDLYRLATGLMDEALEESLDDPAVLSLVEWSERLAKRDIPGDGLFCRLFLIQGNERQVDLDASGPLGNICLELTASHFALSAV